MTDFRTLEFYIINFPKRFFNLRPGGGREHFDHTNWFFANNVPPFLAYLFIHQFRTLPENYSRRSSQVRSPGQVKWPDFKNIHDCAVTIVFNSHRAGGTSRRPIRFFADSEKTAARSATGFCIPFHASFPHLSWKYQPKVIAGQVTRSSQVTQPPKTFMIALWLQFLRNQHETLRG